MKGLARKGISGLLAVLMCLMTVITAGNTAVYAAGETSEAYLVTFPRLDDVNQSFGEGGWGHGPRSFMNGWAAEDIIGWNIHAQGDYEGQVCYCIQPGVIREVGDVYTSFGESFWDNYPSSYNGTIDPATIKTMLGRIMQYGYQGNVSTSWYSQNSGDADKIAHNMATQILVWEAIVGERDRNFDHVSTGGKDAVKSCIGTGNPLYSRFCSYYDSMVASVKSHGVVPSFMAGSGGEAQTVEMEWNGSEYSATLTDSNNVLSKFSFSSEMPEMRFSVRDNQLTITSAAAPAAPVSVTAVKNQQRSGVIVWSDGHYGPNSGVQDVITYSASVSDPVNAYLNVKVSYGRIKIVKESEDGNVAGVSFTVTGEGGSKTVETDDSGESVVGNLLPGTYTVSESAAEWYEPQPPQTVTVESGKETPVLFSNVLKRGSLQVSKSCEDGLNEGIRFHLSGTSDSGIEVDEYAETDGNGEALFEDVLIGTGYVIEEVDTAIRYVVPEKQEGTVEWNAVAEKAFDNILKKFRVTVSKTDEETGQAQGDAVLSGAVYGLYRGEELTASYATDGEGRFTSEYFPCGDDWTVREITPSEGYLLDTEIYPVGAEPELYEIELNDTANDVTEKVIKGNVSLIKHSDGGETGIDTPETGAEFQIYLRSAGSFEEAKDSEKDSLVCDEHGYAESKQLPYGTYTIHQVSGWEGREPMPDFDVFISSDGETYRFLLNNALFESYIRIVKTDEETGKTIPYAGAAFQIYDPQGEQVTMTYTYPEITVLDTFYTNAEGTLVTPEKLAYGKGYSLVEVQAPFGYVLDGTPLFFDVAEDSSSSEDDITLIVLEKTNAPQKGVITVVKTGEVFAGVTQCGEEYTPRYEARGLAGAVYEIRAKEDIATPEGTVRVESGTLVDTVTTDEDGRAQSRELYLGKYEITEISAPYGMVLNTEGHAAELVYAGQTVAVTETSVSFCNERQKAQVSLLKSLETDDAFGIGKNGEIGSVVFGLFAAKPMTAADGSVIPENGLLGTASCDENGKAVFSCDIPVGTEAYVKEISADPHYLLPDAEYGLSFEYAGDRTALVEIAVRDGKAIANKLIRGYVRGLKTDEDGKPVPGAVFGLFGADEKEFTIEHALLSSVANKEGLFLFERVPYGDYVIREVKPAEGFVLNETVYPVLVREDNDLAEIGFENLHITGAVRVVKVDADFPKNRLPGAEFEVWLDLDEDRQFSAEKDVLAGMMTEGETGVYQLEGLRFGGYFVCEKKAPEGYLKDDGHYYFEIREDGKTVTVENKAGVGFANKAKTGALRIEKTSGDGTVRGFTFLVEGKNFSQKYITDGNGLIQIEGLRTGEYTVSEVADAATEKYKIPGKVTVNVTENKTTVAKVHNELKPKNPDNPKTGDDTHMTLWAGIASASLAGILATAYLTYRKKRRED